MRAAWIAVPIHAAHYGPASGLGTQMDFAGNSVGVAVNGGGTALLASDVRASIFLP